MSQPIDTSYLDLDSKDKTFLDSTEMVLNMGPQHPSTHGVFRMDIVLDGEQVVKLKPVFGYLHRNHEKIGEGTTVGINTVVAVIDGGGASAAMAETAASPAADSVTPAA